MKTHFCSPRVLGTLVTLMTVLLLCQCSMPPRQAWQYIQTNGLFTYLGYTTGRSSPPLRAGPSYQQRYAARTYRPSNNWYMNWGSGMPNRIHYSSAYSPNRYYGSVPSYQSPRPAPRPRSSSPAPSVRIPVDEPAPASQIATNEPPAPAPTTTPTPKTDTTPPAAAKPASDLPYGTPVAGRPNMVNSPYAGKTQLVDVSGMGPGQTVKCPYTGKLFKVPVQQQATNNAESQLESPKLADPKSEEKKP